MKTWRLAHIARRCGHCHAAIAAGQTYLEYRVGTARTLLRCQPCGEQMTGAPAPDVVDDTPPPPAPVTVRHQPSLGLEPVGAIAEHAWRRRGRR